MPRSGTPTGRAWRRGRRWATSSAASAWLPCCVWSRWRGRTQTRRTVAVPVAVAVADGHLLGFGRDLDAEVVETLADAAGEGGLVRHRHDATRVLAPLHPALVVFGGPDLQHLGAQQGDVDDVAAHAAQLDAVADAVDASRRDVEPPGDGADDLLHGEGDAGGR